MPYYCNRFLKLGFCILVSFLLLSQENVYANNLLNINVVANSNLPFKHLGKKDGLSGRSIYGIERDSHDLVWIATNYGLNSFDGYRVKTYPTTEGAMLNSKALAVDSNDNVWLLSYDGLYVLRPLHKNLFGENPMLSLILPEDATNGRCHAKIEGMKKTSKHGIMVWDNKTLTSLETDGQKIEFDEPISDICDQIGGNGLLAISQSGKIYLINESIGVIFD